jgi:hypothetical protein
VLPTASTPGPGAPAPSTASVSVTWLSALIEQQHGALDGLSDEGDSPGHSAPPRARILCPCDGHEFPYVYRRERGAAASCPWAALVQASRRAMFSRPS